MLKKTCCFTSATLGFRPIGTLSLLFPLFHCVSCGFLFSQCACLPYWSSAHLQLGFLLSLTVNLNWFLTTSSLLCGWLLASLWFSFLVCWIVSLVFELGVLCFDWVGCADALCDVFWRWIVWNFEMVESFSCSVVNCGVFFYCFGDFAYVSTFFINCCRHLGMCICKWIE